MSLRHAPEGPIVLVGGSGVVGRALIPLLHRLEGRPLVVTGRSAARAEEALVAARALGVDATFLPYAVGETLSTRASAVIGLVNDPDDALLGQVVAASVPFVDITRWTSRVAVAMARLSLAPPRAPVVLSSGWMGGLLARVARSMALGFADPVRRIDGAVRYALADASGEDSVDYMDRLWVPFEVPGPGGLRVIEPFRDDRVVRVDGHPTRVFRFDTPEQWTLPIATDVPEVAVRLGFDSGAAGLGLWALVRLGVFRLLRGDRFRTIRRSLLRTPGSEKAALARSSFRVDVSGAGGHAMSRTIVGEGQAKLTAVGAWLALRQGLSSGPGVHLPEQDPDHASLLSVRLPAAGVTVFDET